MNENEQLERELRSIHPKEPSAGFERRVEEALGESARLAVRQIPELENVDPPASVSSFKPFSVPGFLLVAAVALVALFSIFPSSNRVSSSVTSSPSIDPIIPTLAVDSFPLEEESPINGVSIDELSAMSDSGWEEPQTQEYLIDFFDEGIVERPGVDPVRRYRYHFIDETIRVNPETNTIIRSSAPRVETFLIGVDPF